MEWLKQNFFSASDLIPPSHHLLGVKSAHLKWQCETKHNHSDWWVRLKCSLDAEVAIQSCLNLQNLCSWNFWYILLLKQNLLYRNKWKIFKSYYSGVISLPRVKVSFLLSESPVVAECKTTVISGGFLLMRRCRVWTASILPLLFCGT